MSDFSFRQLVRTTIFSVAFLSIPLFAHAISYNFQYTFSSGNTLAGMLEGTLSAPLVHVTPFIAESSGQRKVEFMAEYSGQRNGQLTYYPFGGNLLSLDGSIMNLFGISDVYIVSFVTEENRATVFNLHGRSFEEDEEFDSSRWVLTEKPSSTVPEPSTIFLLGSGIAGLATWQYRKKRI